MALAITASNLLLPPEGIDTKIFVDTSELLSIGMIVVVDGPATFRVTNLGAGNFKGIFLNLTTDLPPGSSIAGGAEVNEAAAPSSCDPEDLVAVAECFDCLSAGDISRIRPYLMCQWENTVNP